jgi:uncharacterized protein (TIGR00251 family)
MNNDYLDPRPDHIRANLKVQPGASRSEIRDVQNGQLRVRVAAAPEDGKANAALISLFSELTGCPKRDIALISGEKSRQKTLTFPPEYLELLQKLV